MSSNYKAVQDLTLCVPRKSSSDSSASVTSLLAQPTVVSSSLPGGVSSIPPNHVLLRVERFGFSANNVTYGMLGEDPHFMYFDFHPAPKTATTSSQTHGVIPVWGFATVARSTHPEINDGERVFGYFGMSRYLLLPVEAKLNKYNFYVPRTHLPDDRRPYNQITRCASDPLYNPQREDELMIYRPLFWTSFWCEDWLHSIGLTKPDSPVRNILISSASAKTAYCLAFVLDLRRTYGTVGLPSGSKWSKGGSKKTSVFRIVGLTSKGNLAFVKSTGLYDSVLTYDEVEKLKTREGSTDKWIYVDVAGNDRLNSSISNVLGSSIVKGVSLGMSHPTGPQSKSSTSFANSNASLEMFFMPEWLVQRRGQLSAKEIVQLQLSGWDALMRTCNEWIQIERIWWAGAKSWMDEVKGVVEAYEEVLNGQVGPDKGIVLSMWKEGETQAISTKL